MRPFSCGHYGLKVDALWPLPRWGEQSETYLLEPAFPTPSPNWPRSSEIGQSRWLGHKLTSANATVPSGPWHRYEHHLDATGLTVGEVMTRTVVSLPEGAPLAEAVMVMRERGVNRIPIIDRRGVVVAILARDDVVEALARVIERTRRVPLRRGASMPPD